MIKHCIIISLVFIIFCSCVNHNKEGAIILSNAEEYANEGLKHLWFIYKNSKNPVEDLESEFRMYLE